MECVMMNAVHNVWRNTIGEVLGFEYHGVWFKLYDYAQGIYTDLKGDEVILMG